MPGTTAYVLSLPVGAVSMDPLHPSMDEQPASMPSRATARVPPSGIISMDPPCRSLEEQPTLVLLGYAPRVSPGEAAPRAPSESSDTPPRRREELCVPLASLHPLARPGAASTIRERERVV